MKQIELINADNLELCRKIAYGLLRRWNCRMNQDDVESICNLALCKAAPRFDPSRGNTFGTFVHYYVKDGLISAIERAVKAKKAVKALANSINPSTEVYLLTDDDEDILPGDPDLFTTLQVDSPETNALRDEKNEMIRHALQQLEECHQEILRLVYYEGQPLQTLAKKWGKTRKNVLRDIELARRALHTELESSGALRTLRDDEI